MFFSGKHIIFQNTVGKVLLLWLLFCAFQISFSQETQKINPEFASGNFIDEVRIIILENDLETVLSEDEMENFYKAFFIKTGSTFNPLLTDLALNRIKEEKNETSAQYELFESATGTGTLGRSVLLKIFVTLGEFKEESTSKKGFLTKEGARDFPIIYESSQAQFKLFLNGGLGLYNDVNPLFAQGEAFTQGNPIADLPAEKGTRFWGEAFLEPGVSGITKLGNSKIYAYGEISALASARNTTDIYSSGSAAFIDFERLYGGFLVTGFGKNKDITINANYGRNFFQLNDGFLFSRYSGSSNAGPRGSVYLSSRTTFQKNANFSFQWKKFRLSGHFVEPQELFKDKQQNINYAIGTFNFNNNKNLDTGISYIQTSGGKGKYAIPDGFMERVPIYRTSPHCNLLFKVPPRLY